MEKVYCIECSRECEYVIKKETIIKTIRDKEYSFNVKKAYCKECGDEVFVFGMIDDNKKSIEKQYREIENIVTVEDIKNMMELYNIKKAPLSFALGFGEITITRYLMGQIPSKEYSNLIRNALENPKHMLALLEKNREKIGNTAYEKAKKAASSLKGLNEVSEKLLSVISYIFNTITEITPLALQKVLYYVQALYMLKYGNQLFDENCQAWVHGPVYKPVYDFFCDFKYNPIDDTRFMLIKNRFKELTAQEKEVIELVMNTFGNYNGKVLEKITHKEDPWINARKGYPDDQPSQEVIEKKSIYDYFKKISIDYDGFKTTSDINNYINNMIFNK